MNNAVLKLILVLGIISICCSDTPTGVELIPNAPIPNTWDYVTPNVKDRYFGVSFLNKNEGWIAGQARYYDRQTGLDGWRSVVYHTVNGGESWLQQLILLGESSLRGVHFFDKLNGITMRHNVFTTANGGNYWKEILKLYGPIVRDMDFTDNSTGWLSGNYNNGIPVVLKSVNRGVTWEALETSFRTNGSGGTFFAISAPSLKTVYAAGSFYEGGILIKTTDGGDTWKDVQVMADPSQWDVRYRSVHFFNDSWGWLGGDYRTIYHTRDGGDTWILQDAGSGSDSINDIHAYNQNNAIAVTSIGNVLVTNDAGNTWVEQDLDATGALYRVFYLDSGVAYAVGSKKVLKGYKIDH